MNVASLLIHVCCAPCTTYTLGHWRKEAREVYGYWYNPNIYPLSEHQLRLKALEDFARDCDFSLIVSPDYEREKYFSAVAGHLEKESRCGFCYRLRLFETALTAKVEGFDAFTTTLSISPYQDHEVLKQVGSEVQLAVGIPFLYEDLRHGYLESRMMARDLDLYRQNYCGCLYSFADRFYHRMRFTQV